jgi:DNA-binding transcriptional regulator LsrR (DeoR family)
MIKAARLYYEGGFTQEAISDRLRLSRPRVSRLLTEARERGIVQFTIAQMPGIFSDLERALESRYNLSEAVVIEVSNPQAHMPTARELGAAAAQYFRRTVQDGDVIGLTWGETLAWMADSLPLEKKNVLLAQMVGGMGDPSGETHATDIARRISHKLGATMSLIPAPGIVDSLEAARLLKSERFIEQAIQTARMADLAFAGLGAISTEATYMRDESIITWEEISPLIERGAVGEIGLHFFDRDGAPVASTVDDRIIGVDLETFKALPRVAVIAGGTEKLLAIQGAVRGGYLKTLITDEGTARFLLDDRE